MCWQQIRIALLDNKFESSAWKVFISLFWCVCCLLMVIICNSACCFAFRHPYIYIVYEISHFKKKKIYLLK